MTTPDEVKNKIVQWCKEDNIPCNVAPDAPNFVWVLTLGRVGQVITIYKTTAHDDRIYIQSQIAWSEVHRTLVNQTWNAQKRNNMMLNLRKLAVQYDCNMTFQVNGDEVIGINTNKIHFHSTISKSELLEKYIRIGSIHLVILDQLNIELGGVVQQSQADENSSNTNTGR